jgi:hypothetical protein
MAVALTLPCGASRAWDGSQTPEVGLDTNQLVLFEDFETPDFGSRWPVHWGSPPGPDTVSAPPENVFGGSRSLVLQGSSGVHESAGSGEYVPEVPVDDVAYFRLHYRLQDGFSMGTCNQLKLFGIRGGATIEDTYGGAGTAPDGTDKFSALLGIHNAMDLHFYYYHPDQPGIYGENTDCDLGGTVFTFSPGRWYCLELMLKANTAGQRDGALKAWVDDTLVGQVDNLRFRDAQGMKLRRFTVLSYFGGAGDQNTSPTDQQTFVDNVVISHQRVGCLGSVARDGGIADGSSRRDSALTPDAGMITPGDDGGTEVSVPDARGGPGGSAEGGCRVALAGRRTLTPCALVLSLLGLGLLRRSGRRAPD